MKNIFVDHPRSMGESYFQHMRSAIKFGINMLLGGLACIIHAIFPFLFVKTGSNFLFKMTHHYVDRMPEIEGRVLELNKRIERKK